jgi:hypothetical protein
MRARHGFRDAEVEHARDAVLSDQDILRWYVAVHEAERFALLARRLVRRVQPQQHLNENRSRERRAERGSRRGQQGSERLTVHVIHDDEELGTRRDDVERRNHVSMTDPYG